MAWLTPRAGRLVVLCEGQSNTSGCDSLKVNAPGDHDRNDSRCFKRDANKRLVTATESIHAGIDPNLRADLTDGFSWVKVAVNDWLDYAPSKTAVLIGRAVGSTRLTTDWAISPESFMSKRAIDDALIGGLSSEDRVVLFWLRGETESNLGGADASGYTTNANARLSFIRTRIGRPNAPAVICQLPSPGVAIYTSWATVQTQIAAMASAVDPKCEVVINPTAITTVHYQAVPDQHIALGHAAGTALISLVPDW
jgi:hypothetical protein